MTKKIIQKTLRNSTGTNNIVNNKTKINGENDKVLRHSTGSSVRVYCNNNKDNKDINNNNNKNIDNIISSIHINNSINNSSNNTNNNNNNNNNNDVDDKNNNIAFHKTGTSKSENVSSSTNTNSLGKLITSSKSVNSINNLTFISKYSVESNVNDIGDKNSGHNTTSVNLVVKSKSSLSLRKVGSQRHKLAVGANTSNNYNINNTNSSKSEMCDVEIKQLKRTKNKSCLLSTD
eukprot:Pgem_evm1s8021